MGVMTLEISEMRLGCFGLAKNEIYRLEQIFKTVEQLTFPCEKNYDLYYMDISFASHRVIDFLRNADVMPMIVKDYFEPAQEVLDFMHPDSYLWLNHNETYFDFELTEKIEEYLKGFGERKREYQLFKERGEKRAGRQGSRDVLMPERDTHDKASSIYCPADVWGRWKGWNRNERVISTSNRHTCKYEADSYSLSEVWTLWKNG